MDTPFRLLRDIRVDDPASWEDALFLTIDMEWASDESIRYLLDRIHGAGARVTVFATHATPIIAELRGEDWIEFGIHPNFNFLLQGDFRYGQSISEVVDYYRQIVPDSVSSRSHCLATGTLFLKALAESGIRYESSVYMPAGEGVTHRPWRSHIPELVCVPMCWEDDIQCCYGLEDDLQATLSRPGLKVLNFHPVTCALNIRSMAQYDANRSHYHDHEALMDRRGPATGVDDLLDALLDEAVTDH